MSRRREVLPLKDRSPQERRLARQILNERKAGGQTKYDPRVHPKGVIEYFRRSFEEIDEPTRVRTKNGDLKFVQKPVKPPLLAGYAVEIGVARETLWRWGQDHEEFGNAVQVAKAMQEQVFLEMAVKGAYNPRTVDLMMKNLQGWKDTIQHEVGPVILNFDEQDEEA